MTVTVHDHEFAPEYLQGVTVSFAYNSGDCNDRVCRANEWWQQQQQSSLSTCVEDDDRNSPRDLTALEQLHEPAVVYCLSRRYQQDHIYTYTGKILLALNPFRPLDDLYGESVMRRYWQSSIVDAATVERPPPHIYAIAEDAYRSMIRSLQSDGRVAIPPEHQSILVSGESGAGKTVTTKIILQYLALLSQKADPNNTSTVGIESKVLESNPVLESFGNARTIRNDNSSRFGKFMEMLFDFNGSLVSASIETYLLEKVRLIQQSPGERNYHVFYELLAGLPMPAKSELHLAGRGPRDFRMTCGGTEDRRDGVSDRETYEELRHALDTVGFTRNEQFDLFAVTSALLHTSNLTFVGGADDASALDRSNPSLRFAVELLGVDVVALNDALCRTAIEARGETLYKRLSVERAEKAVEALIKTTYGALFAYIVRKINSFITVQRDDENGSGRRRLTASIGVLDIFGFESFDCNSFEQLCINYCNEALQQQFNRFVFKLEQEEYQKEGIDWSFIEFPDNQDVLDLIEKKHDGIFSVLDEQSRLPRCTDATFASAIYQKCSSHTRFEATKTMRAQFAFAIHHYAGLVEYDTEFFLEKNKDELPKETTELLKSSSYPFLAMLGVELTSDRPAPLTSSAAATIRTTRGAPATSRSSRTLQRSSSSLLRDSVGSQFCSQLKLLRTRIESTSPHYVRCLKPNDRLVPHSFDALVIADQLRCAGVLEAIRVSRVGFPNRYYHGHFVQRYELLERGAVAEYKDRSQLEQCGILVDLLSPKLLHVLDPQGDDQEQNDEAFLGMQMGKTKVFIRRRAFEALEYIRGKTLEDSATRIQSGIRMFLARINYEISLYAVILIQKFIRQIGAYRLANQRRIERSVDIIQRFLRCCKARKRLQSARLIACWCQSAFRGAIARQYCAYLFLDQKASVIQRSWKRHHYSAARTFRKLRSCVMTIQNRHRARQAFRELKRLRVEARDLKAVAAERDKFKKESKRLRQELEKAKNTPEKIIIKPDPQQDKSAELDKLRMEVKNLQQELEKARRMSSPSKDAAEQALALEQARLLADELAQREQELAALRQEVASLRSKEDHSSRSPAVRSLTIETSLKDLSLNSSLNGSFASPRLRASPARSEARSDVSLLDDDDIEDNLLGSMASPIQQEVIGDELKQLHTAIRQGNIAQLNHVLQRTSEVCVLVNQGDKFGRTAMHLAALTLDLEIAERLIVKGAVVNAQDDDGETPLHLSENAAMAEFLLTKGKANPNIPNVDGICALHLAVQRRDIDSVRALIVNHANVNNADNIRWFTALHLISLPARKESDQKNGDDSRCKIAQMLTGVYGQNVPDVNYQDSEGNSPLHYAVQLESDDACELVNILLEKDANPNLCNSRDQVPLHLLCHNDKLRRRRNYQEILHSLLLHGADPSIQSLTGCTPLHLSLYHKDIDSAIQLVQSGAELHHLWKKPKRWPAFWDHVESSGVLALDMVEKQDDLRRILSVITTSHQFAPSRSHCMQCKTTLSTFSRAHHCRNCSRLTCKDCSKACLPPEYFPKNFKVSEPSWACTVCEKILTARKEVLSDTTRPTSSYGEGGDDDDEDDEDRYSC